MHSSARSSKKAKLLWSIGFVDVGWITNSNSLISADFFPGRGTSLAVFSLNFAVNIVVNTSDHIPRILRWTWNLSSSTTNTASLNCHGWEKSSQSEGFDILWTTLWSTRQSSFSSPVPLGLICNWPWPRDQETTGYGDEKVDLNHGEEVGRTCAVELWDGGQWLRMSW